jgi:hypothetical protein
MKVDIPANKKFVSCFIAYLGFQEKASDGEGLAYEWICWEFITPCFVLLTVAFDFAHCCFCIIVISSELALRFYFFILLSSLPRSKHGDDETRYEKNHYYTPQLLQTSRHSTTRYQKSDFSSGRPHDFNESSLRMFTTTTPSSSTSFTHNGHAVYIAVTTQLAIWIGCHGVCTTSLFFPLRCA